MTKVKSFFMTTASAEKLNKITALVLLIGAILVFIGLVIMNFLFLHFKSTFQVFNNYNVPIINFIFNDFYIIVSLFLFFVVFAVLLVPGLLKRITLAYYLFFVFNGLLIIANLLFIWFGKLFNADVLYIADIINYMPEETERLLFTLNCSYFFQGVILSLVHGWLIWRYAQIDVKRLFKIKD